MSRRPSLPAMPPPFPPAFESLLHTLLGRSRDVASARDDQRRARRAVLSQSGTFVGHRPYVRGDDPRRIDWAACARTGGFFVKQLEQEERRSTALLLDLSPSLGCGETPRRVWQLRVAAVLGGLALLHLDGVSVLAPGAGDAEVRAFAGARALPALLRHLQSLPFVVVEPSHAIARAMQEHLPARVHWLSDFADPAAVARPLQALRRGGIAVTGWLPEVPADRDPAVAGYVRVVDPCSGNELAVPIDAALRTELRAQLATLATRQDRLFLQAGAPLVRWLVPAVDDTSVGPWAPLVARGSA